MTPCWRRSITDETLLAKCPKTRHDRTLGYRIGRKSRYNSNFPVGLCFNTAVRLTCLFYLLITRLLSIFYSKIYPSTVVLPSCQLYIIVTVSYTTFETLRSGNFKKTNEYVATHDACQRNDKVDVRAFNRL